MATTLRLMRFGKKGHPYYRILVIDKRKKRDGSYIERIGSYDPMTEPAKVELKKDRYEYWKGVGAEISEGLAKLLKNPERVSFVESAK